MANFSADLASSSLISQVVSRWEDVNAQRIPVPPLLAKATTPIFFALHVITLLPSPGPFRVVLGLSLYTTIWTYAVTHWKADPSFFVDAVFMFCYTLRWLLIVLPSDPEKKYWQTSPTATKLLDKGTWQQLTWRKLQWAAEFSINWRGMGWNFEDRGLTKGREQTQSRIWFLLENVAWVFVGMQAMKYIMAGPFCQYWPHGDIKFEYYTLPALHRHILTFLQLVRDWIMLDVMYRQFAIVSVASFLSTPDRFPAYNGSVLDLYSVRNFWGKGWHQTFRILYSTSATLVSDALALKKGSFAMRYTKLYVGFLVSAVQHLAITVFIQSPEYRWGMFWQMPAYAAVITAEDFLSFLGKKLGIQNSPFVRLAGYAWTAFWMTTIYSWVQAYHNDIGSFAGVCST